MLWKHLNITISITKKKKLILLFTAFYQKKCFLQPSHQQLEEKTPNFFTSLTPFLLREQLYGW